MEYHKVDWIADIWNQLVLPRLSSLPVGVICINMHAS